jgi:A/G-specific adenine glycosylase
VGRYTAGAVACFAYERVAATVDTNVARVIRRVFHPRLRKKPLARQVWRTALEILPRTGKQAWEVNQALMELGALICTARVAKCGVCPVRNACCTGAQSREKERREG